MNNLQLDNRSLNISNLIQPTKKNPQKPLKLIKVRKQNELKKQINLQKKQIKRPKKHSILLHIIQKIQCIFFLKKLILILIIN